MTLSSSKKQMKEKINSFVVINYQTLRKYKQVRQNICFHLTHVHLNLISSALILGCNYRNKSSSFAINWRDGDQFRDQIEGFD